MINALWARFWPYVAGFSALIAVALGLRQSGKAAARTEAAAEINETQAKARKEARNVDEKVDSLSDAAIRERAKRWVRDK